MPVVACQAHFIAVVDVCEAVQHRNVLHRLRQRLKELSIALQELP
jgi:hypothetical protein